MKEQMNHINYENQKNIMERNKIDNIRGETPMGFHEKNQFTDESEGTMVWVSTRQISMTKVLSRTHFPEYEQEMLTRSIKSDGMIVPLIVSKGNNGSYHLQAGVRRWLSARKIGLEKVPCIIKSGEPILTSLRENVLRESLTVVEEAEACAFALEKIGMNQKQLARALGKSTTAMNDIIRLNDLPAAIKERARGTKAFSRNALLTIVRLNNEDGMIEAFEKLVKKTCNKPENQSDHKTGSNGKSEKAEPRTPANIFAYNLGKMVLSAQKIEKKAITQKDIAAILAGLQNLEVQLVRLGIKKSRIRDFFFRLNQNRIYKK